MSGLLFCRRAVFDNFLGHTVSKILLPPIQSPAVLLAEHGGLVPAGLSISIIIFRWRLLLAYLLLATFLDALGEDDLGVGVAVFALLDLAVGILDHRGDIVEA